jgi:hypothetical protein
MSEINTALPYSSFVRVAAAVSGVTVTPADVAEVVGALSTVLVAAGPILEYDLGRDYSVTCFDPRWPS